MKKCIVVVVVLVATVALASADIGGAAVKWLSVPEAPVFDGKVAWSSRAADGTSWFARTFTNSAAVVRARWTVAGLGVFDVYVNGRRIGDDFLKPGFTHWQKTKYAFAYDVTDALACAAGAVNVLAAEVSAGWWRDKIVTPEGRQGFAGRKSAFRGVLELEYANGATETIATEPDTWRCGIAGPVTHAAIFDGEEYDARIPAPVRGEGLCSRPEVNAEFSGEILPTDGAEIVLRRDLTMRKGPFVLRKGEKKVVDFGQNCAGVPEFAARAPAGAVLTILPAEMLNDADRGTRGCDGPAGSVYRANLRIPNDGMRAVYTFAGKGLETYLPRFTFFGYRYVELSATADVEFEFLSAVPVTSVKQEHETGSFEVGDPALDRFIRNVYWGQLSNYLSVPTDCPQRNERLGWAADTQVFTETGSFNADTRKFFKKYTRDLRDSRCARGGFPSVAPTAQYGNETFNLGWADVGVIVPWTVWKQYGELSILQENWEAMSKFVRVLDETQYDFEGKLGYIYADWLSYEKFETCGNSYGGWKKWKDDPDAKAYRRFLAACYWLYDARLMVEMGTALGRQEETEFFRASAARALAHIRTHYVEADGLLLQPMRELQTACVFALRLGIVEGEARDKTLALLVKSIEDHGGCLQTGFLGTSFIMDALSGAGRTDVAYTLLLQHRNPSWLYSVDQGATTVWERWNSYTKQSGFGPVGMNSFNHYAYGAVLGWMYRNVAGIANAPGSAGFKKLLLAPHPDRRLGFVKASYRSVSGMIRSAWRYEGDRWIWDFEIPAGVEAIVRAPGQAAQEMSAGSHRIELPAR
ncbi:MAG: family 78 glycoside hydrolase catalytic domain [Kiritimatiellia bacterium]